MLLLERLLVLPLARCLIGVTLAAGGILAAHAQPTVRVLTWSEYMDPAVVEAFEKEHGAKVEFIYFESDDVRTSIVARHDGEGFDVVLVNGNALPGYVRRGWLAPVDDTLIPNRRHMASRWRNASDAARAYGTAYTWGTTGIAYRRDLVPQRYQNWRQLLSPDEALRGRILMVRTMRDSLGVALKAAGHTVNPTSASQVADAADLLARQRPFVRDFSYLGLGQNSVLVTGEIWAAMLYNGDAVTLQQLDPNIEYVVPEEGTILWVDYFALSGKSDRRTIGAAFIDFLNRPAVAAQNALYLNFATANESALAHLPAEHLANPIIYPTPEVLERSEVIGPVPPRILRKMNSVFSSVLRAD